MDGHSKGEVIEIPIGRIGSFLRHNIWMIVSVVLAVALVSVLFGGNGGITGQVSSSEAASNLLEYINSQGNGEATLVSSDNKGSLYEVVVNYQGQDIPVFVTLDGTYLVPEPILLSGGVLPTGSGSAGSGTVVNVEIGDAPILGDVNAPVTIIEFSDYECPFCGRHYTDTYPQLKAEYIDTGKVKLVFKDFPLSFHPNAQKAAEAARCFGEQKGDAGYFMMHDKLFENQQTLSLENYKKWARELGANGAEFDTCLDSGRYASAVQADMTQGQQSGVSGTPGFFINGIMVEGAQPYSVFKQIIDSELVAQ